MTRASEQALARELDVLSSGTQTGQRRTALLAAAEAWSAEVWLEAEAAGPRVPDPDEVARGLTLAARPVFVCGVHRSGTTLLRDLLDGHPDLCVLPSEGTFLTSLSPRLRRLPTKEWCGVLTREWLCRLANLNQGPFWYLGRSTADADPYLQYARRVLGWWPVLRDALGGSHPMWPHVAIVLAYDASRSPDMACDATRAGDMARNAARRRDTEGEVARYWVDKTPTNELHVATLLEAFPAARVIQMIRDPRAVLASRRRLEERFRGRFVRVDRVLGELAASMRVALEAERHASVHLVVRYEALVSSPDRELRRIASFLDIPPHPTLHRTTVAGRPSSANSSFDVAAEPGAIHSGDAIDRHGSELDERLVEAYLGLNTALLGYEIVPMGNVKALLTRLRIRGAAVGDVLRG